MVKSPISSGLSEAIFLSTLRMILPDRVFGRFEAILKMKEAEKLTKLDLARTVGQVSYQEVMWNGVARDLVLDGLLDVI